MTETFFATAKKWGKSLIIVIPKDLRKTVVQNSSWLVRIIPKSDTVITERAVKMNEKYLPVYAIILVEWYKETGIDIRIIGDDPDAD